MISKEVMRKIEADRRMTAMFDILFYVIVPVALVVGALVVYHLATS